MDLKSFPQKSLDVKEYCALAETMSTFIPRMNSRASESSAYRYSDGDLNLMSRSTSLFSLCSPRATLPNSAILSIPYFSAFSFLKVRSFSIIWSREVDAVKTSITIQRYGEKSLMPICQSTRCGINILGTSEKWPPEITRQHWSFEMRGAR